MIKQKNYLKFGILLFGISLIFTACEKDEPNIKTESSQEIQKIIRRDISFNDLPNINLVSEKLNTIRKNLKFNNRTGIQSREFDSDSVTIVTDNILYMTYEGTHTLTFKVIRNYPEHFIENIVLHYNLETETYDEFFVQYDITPQEFLDYSNGIQLPEDTVVLMEKLDNGTFSGLVNRGFCTTSCVSYNFNCTAGGNHQYGEGCDGSLDQQPFQVQICNTTCYNTHQDNEITDVDGPNGGGGTTTTTIITNPNPVEPCNTSTGETGIVNNNGDCLPVNNTLNPIEDDDECNTSEENFNAYYSVKSPFNVDLSAVSNCYNIDTEDIEENQKFMCIYNKLTQSPKFKNLFLDTFGESDNLNVKFELVDHIPGANGQTGLLPNSINNINQTTGEVNLNLLIKIDKSYMDSHSAIAVAKTIMHESIHAYLILKHIKCNVGTPFDEIMEDIDDKSLEELLNYYYDTACPNEEQHEFMFEHMIPTMSEILADVRDELVPLSHQQNAEADTTFFDEANPTGPQVSWSWEQFYKYLSMAGLQNSDSFQWDIAPGSVKYQNYIKYTIDYGKNGFRKDCLD